MFHKVKSSSGGSSGKEKKRKKTAISTVQLEIEETNSKVAELKNEEDNGEM